MVVVETDPNDPSNTIPILIGSYAQDGGTLTITFNDNATAARINAVLQSLTYANLSENPPAGTIVIAYTFDDGEQAQGSVSVAITAVDDAPTVDGLVPAIYQPGSSLVIGSGIALADPDSATLTGATVTLSAFDATDLLSVTVGSSGIAASYNPGSGVLTLSGSASVTAYQQVLSTLTYSSSSNDPASFGATRTVTIDVSDGSLTGSQALLIDFTPATDLDGSAAGTGFATAFNEGGAAVAIADSDDHVGAGANNIESATITLTNAQSGDVLSASGLPGNITADLSVPNQITLNSDGSATAADFATALQHVFFGNASANVNPATRDVTVVLRDTNGAGNTAHTTIAVNAVNDPGSASDDFASTSENMVLQVAAAQGVLVNDNDPDGLSVIIGSTTTSGGGSIQFNPDGSYIYTPKLSFIGTDTVSYTAQDPFGSQVSATLHIR